LVHVVAPEIDRRREAIAHELQQAGIRVDHMSVIAPSLEDVFIASLK
jgi:hypothetical protein